MGGKTEVDDMARLLDQVVVHCPCCLAVITMREWAQLPDPPMGSVWDDEDTHLELKNCRCGSTLSIPLVALEEVLDGSH